jgi:hypothetical protein
MKLNQFSVFYAAINPIQNPLALLGGILLCLLSPPNVHAQGVTFAWAQTTLHRDVNLAAPTVDSSGNVFFADEQLFEIDELMAVNGNIPANPTIKTVASDIDSYAMAVDGSGNIFFSGDNFSGSNGLNEIEAVNGSIPPNPTIRTFPGLDETWGVAVDQSGDIFVADLENKAIKEIVAVNGSVPAGPVIKTLASGSFDPYGVAVDSNGNVFFADPRHEVLEEIVAVDGSIPVNPTIRVLGIPPGGGPSSVAVDPQGDVFFTDSPKKSIIEILAVNGSIPTENPTFVDLGNKDSSLGYVATDQKDNLFVEGAALTESYVGPRLAEVQLGSVNFGSVEVCPAGQTTAGPCSRTISLTYQVAAGTTIGGVNVLTAGAKNLDFQAEASDTSTTLCSAQTYSSATTCTVDVTFAPTASGQRNGTVQIVDGSGNVLATTPIYGIGPNQTITFAAISSQVIGGSVALTATASSGLPVTFGSGNLEVCTVSGTTASLLSDGICTITATQDGNASYLPVLAAQTFTVGHASQTIDFPTIAPQVASLPLILDATASSGLPVTFTSNTPTVCTVRGDRATLLIAGSCDIIATQAGNSEYFATVIGQTFLVHHRDQIITFDAIPSQPTGTTLPLTASSDSDLPITYTSTTSTVCTVSGSTASLLNTGTCTIQASQAGDATWFPSGPKTVSFTVE